MKMTNHIIPFVDIQSADYHEIGYEIGRALREKIHIYWEWLRKLYEVRTDASTLVEIAKETILYIQKYFPQYYDELKGMAEGAEIKVKTAALMCDEEMIMHQLHARCTTIAISCDGRVLLGHNEDWSPGYEQFLYVVRVRSDESSFLSLAYVGSLPGTSIALNSAGIAFSGDSILRGSQPGVPKSIILRSQIEAWNLKEFVKLAKFSPRAIPTHSMAINIRGYIASVELSLQKASVVWTRDWYVHTNHLVHPKMQGIELSITSRSQKRYERSIKYLRENLPNVDLLKKILSSHDEARHSICLHASSEEYSGAQTIGSAIADLKNGTLTVWAGNPCKEQSEVFHLL